MHTYKSSREEGSKGPATIFTVGFAHPNGEWTPMEDFDNETEAQEMVSWLNGGIHRCVEDKLAAIAEGVCK